MIHRHRTLRCSRRPILALVVVMGIGACTSGSDEAAPTSAAPTTSTTQPATTTTTQPATTTTAAAAEPIDTGALVHGQPGPYDVGVVDLDLDGRLVKVWYPAATPAPASAAPDVFEIRELVPADFAALVPDELNPVYPTDAYLDLSPASDGPFPVIGISHGFAAYPTIYAFLATHLAGWGNVVVAPHHSERGLFAVITGQITEGDDAAVLLASIDLALAAGGPLAGLGDPARIATVGHSAGVTAAAGAAVADPRIGAVVALAGGSDTTPLPGVPTLLIAGGSDAVSPVDQMAGFADRLEPDRRFVVIDGAGHNAFTDLCLIGAEQGGLLQIVDDLGLPADPQLLALLADGCTDEYVSAADTWPITRQLVLAHIRVALGVDPEPAPRDPQVAGATEIVTID
jgi:dienelactone hydrolase